MPRMDGLTFLRTYKARGGTGLVIVMSAYGGEDAALAAMKEGAYDYLPKPFRPRSEEHTSELQSQSNLVCRLLLEKKKFQQERPFVAGRALAPAFVTDKLCDIHDD